MSPIRHAQAADLPAIVAIYNAAVPGRMATADTEPVTVASRESWFRDFDAASRPLWVLTDIAGQRIDGWLSLRSFYGRPAYRATAEVAVYVDPARRQGGIARDLMNHALASTPALGIRTVLAFVFAHNGPSIALFVKAGFVRWGLLPGVAELDGVRRDLAIFGWTAP